MRVIYGVIVRELVVLDRTMNVYLRGEQWLRREIGTSSGGMIREARGKPHGGAKKMRVLKLDIVAGLPSRAGKGE